GFAGAATSQNNSSASTDPRATAAVPGAAASNSLTGKVRAGGGSAAPTGTPRNRAVVTPAGNSTCSSRVIGQPGRCSKKPRSPPFGPRDSRGTSHSIVALCGPGASIVTL